MLPDGTLIDACLPERLAFAVLIVDCIEAPRTAIDPDADEMDLVRIG